MHSSTPEERLGMLRSWTGNVRILRSVCPWEGGLNGGIRTSREGNLWWFLSSLGMMMKRMVQQYMWYNTATERGSSVSHPSIPDNSWLILSSNPYLKQRIRIRSSYAVRWRQSGNSCMHSSSFLPSWNTVLCKLSPSVDLLWSSVIKSDGD